MAEMDGKKEKCSHLRRKRFCGSDADFGAGMRVDHTIGLAGDGGIYNVRYCNRARPLGFRFPLRRCCVGGLAGLGNHDCKFAWSDQRVAVSELAGIVHIDRHPRQFLDHVLTNHPGMAAGARGYDVDTPQGLQFFRLDVYVFEVNTIFFGGNPWRDSGVEALRLFEDLLNHVMRETAFISHAAIFLDCAYRTHNPAPPMIVFFTSPLGLSTTISARAPGVSVPRVSRRVTRAGFSVASRTACWSSHSANFITLRTAAPVVNTLPASFPSAMPLPAFTCMFEEPRG